MEELEQVVGLGLPEELALAGPAHWPPGREPEVLALEVLEEPEVPEEAQPSCLPRTRPPRRRTRPPG